MHSNLIYLNVAKARQRRGLYRRNILDAWVAKSAPVSIRPLPLIALIAWMAVTYGYAVYVHYQVQAVLALCNI